MSGKLIIIDGTDGSGKTTQTERLFNRLQGEGLRVRKVKFPDYESDSSALVEMYLAGEFGAAREVNPYAASAFYAVDRYASFKTKWGDFYRGGGLVIADRYTTSNMIHQAEKFGCQDRRMEFLEWVEDFEFNLCGLPRPDGVVFLDMPPENSRQLVDKRRKETDRPDVHEDDPGHMQRAYSTACEVAERYGWYRVQCVDQGQVRGFDAVHRDVYRSVKKILAGSRG